MAESESILPEQAGGDFLPELVPVFGTSVEQQHLEAQQPIVAAEDILFGEIIDISDLIPRLSPEAAAPGISLMEMTYAVKPSAADGSDALAASGHAGALTILYDDDILASGGAIL
ncbi:hypothetical protein [Mesorhizobium sp. KR9-304]|uniref:hypothetical protein n=1 Tax=Mesorhizobium sp. KR9-304 TaxID=3156614 RepID=UPI0032B31E6E